MKNVILAAILLICISIPRAGAQTIDFGFNGGLIFSSLSSDEEYNFMVADERDVTFSVHDDSYTGFHFGVFAEVGLLSFFLQPGLTYTKTGQEMSLSYQSEEGMTRTQELTSEFSHIKLPLMAGTQLTIARVAVGPVFSVMLDQSDDAIQDFQESYVDFNNASVGYQLMAGLKYARFTLDYRFEGTFTSLGDQITLGDQSFNFDTNPRQHFISLGIILF